MSEPPPEAEARLLAAFRLLAPRERVAWLYATVRVASGVPLREAFLDMFRDFGCTKAEARQAVKAGLQASKFGL